jgi:hypothetical protein
MDGEGVAWPMASSSSYRLELYAVMAQSRAQTLVCYALSHPAPCRCRRTVRRRRPVALRKKSHLFYPLGWVRLSPTIRCK